jgi:hypothetical protein
LGWIRAQLRPLPPVRFVGDDQPTRARGAPSAGIPMKTLLALSVNGLPREEAVAGTTLLIEFLRDGLGLTGTKMGCDDNRLRLKDPSSNFSHT